LIDFSVQGKQSPLPFLIADYADDTELVSHQKVQKALKSYGGI
jgi:hypothetical protein